MNERLKKVLLLALFLLVVALMGYGLYYFFFRSKPTSLPRAEQPGLNGQLPQAGLGGTRVTNPSTANVELPNGLPSGEVSELPSGGTINGGVTQPESRVRVMSEQPLNAMSLNPKSGDIRAYNPQDGKFYRLDDNGKMVALSDRVFYNVEKVSWGKVSDKAIMSFPDDSKILYDFAKQRQVTLPKQWDEFDFSPSDDGIAAKSLGNNPTNRFLVIANPEGGDAQYVESLGDNADKVTVSWSPNDQIVGFAMTGESMGYDRQAIVPLGKNQENFKNLVVEGRGFVPNWSPNGKQILYSVYSSGDSFKPTLWTSGAAGDDINEGRRNLQIETWADKCVWQNETTVYCAVPTRLDTGAGMQRDLFANVPDELVRIDLTSGKKISLGTPDGNPAIQQLSLAPDGRALYYTDRLSGKLIRFSLE